MEIFASEKLEHNLGNSIIMPGAFRRIISKSLNANKKPISFMRTTEPTASALFKPGVMPRASSAHSYRIEQWNMAINPPLCLSPTL